ncbi:MAG: lantibiotic dehydratase [Candidatus Krumholzibacteriia bacterium]
MPFFIMRTPLWPTEAFLAWSRDPVDGEIELQEADRRAKSRHDSDFLNAGLRAACERSEFREAVRLSSEDLDSVIESWLQTTGRPLDERAIMSLSRYFSRISYRPTPFGIFAGFSVGTVGEHTHLKVGAIGESRLATRIDARRVRELVRQLLADRSLRASLKWVLNESAHVVAGIVHCLVLTQGSASDGLHLSTLDHDVPLEAIIGAASQGATWAELRDALAPWGPTPDEADDYLHDIVDSGLILAELELAGIDVDPLPRVADALRRSGHANSTAATIAEVLARLRDLDQLPPGQRRSAYEDVRNAWRQLGTQMDDNNLFHVQLRREAPNLSLAHRDLAHLVQTVDHLSAVFPLPVTSRITAFQSEFWRRYESRQVPLLEVLNPDFGLGYPCDPGGPHAEAEVLCRVGLAGRSADRDPSHFLPLHAMLLQQLDGLRRRDHRQLDLTADQISPVRSPEPLPLPDAVQAIARYIRSDDSAPDSPAFYLASVSGPSAMRTTARFCHGHPDLLMLAMRFARAEEALQPGVILADLSAINGRRSDNVINRPALYEHELPVFKASGIDGVQVVHPRDLLLSLQGGNFVLRHGPTGRTVVPRLTTAVSHRTIGTPLARFLGDLQGQGRCCGAFWNWGPLDCLPFLPRVCLDQTVVALMRWRLAATDIPGASNAFIERYRAFQSWREENAVPRFVELLERASPLLVDLENEVFGRMVFQQIDQRGHALLRESLPYPGDGPVGGDDGHYAHELMIPMIRPQSRAKPAKRTAPPLTPASGEVHTHLPGQEWISLHIYCNEAQADRVLLDIAQAHRTLNNTHAPSERWFFVRYHDPEFHLRVRFHGEPDHLNSVVLPGLVAALDSDRLRGLVHRVRQEGYTRENDRYGGPQGTRLAEELFNADSQAVAEIITVVAPDALQESRLFIAMLGVDTMLDDFDLSLQDKLELARRRYGDFASELRISKQTFRAISREYRAQESLMASIWDGPVEARLGPAIATGRDAFLRRSRCLDRVIGQLRELQEQGLLSRPIESIVPSFLHMHVNRLIHTRARAHECLVFSYLSRLYSSRCARM